MTGPPLLEVSSLTATFASGVGLRGVSLSVYPRQTLAIVGESGSGKSLTALSIMRLLPRTARVSSGSIVLRVPGETEQDLLKVGESQMRQIRGARLAMIFQEPMTSLNPVFTVGDQVAEAVMLHRRASRQQATQETIAAFARVGITDAPRRVNQYPHEFSGGMRQRVMIAMALACHPRLLLADEPTTALDVTVQSQILDLLTSLREERGMGVVLITHDLGLVSQRADVVCVMYAGRVVEYASCRDVMTRPLHPYTRALLACAPRLGDRRERLATVAESVGDARAAQIGENRQAWWPGHTPPANAQPGNDSCVLANVAPRRWVGVWRTGDEPEARPDVPPSE